jgi:hypothetical protein
MNRVSPIRKGIVRFTTAPVVSPQPKPPMRGTNLPCPVAPCSGLLLAPRHGWNLTSGRGALQAPLGCGSHTCAGSRFARRPWGRSAGRPCPAGWSRTFEWLRASGGNSTAGTWRGAGAGLPARGGSPIMRNLTFEPRVRDRGMWRMWGMRDLPRSRWIGSVGRLCMLRGATARMGGRHTHAPGAAVDVATLTLSHSRVRDHARAARTPRGTGPMDAERSEAQKD